MCNPKGTAIGSSETAISLSIVVFRTPFEQLVTAINSAFIALQTASIEARSRITVIDNENGDSKTRERLRPLVDRLNNFGCTLDCVQGHGNIGYGAAHNLAFELEHRPLHVFMNADVELDSQAFVHGCAYFRTHDDVAMISPAACDGWGNRQFLCKRYPSVFDLLLRGFAPDIIKRVFARRLARYEMRELSACAPNEDISITSGCFMFCRSSIIERLKGFDSSFFLYFEDFDLSLRVSREGKLVYLPNVKIKHEGGNSARKGVLHIIMFIRSACRFFSLHGWRWI